MVPYVIALVVLQTGTELTVADAAVGGVVLPLWTKVLGVDEQ